jgi:ubiquinol-cytochrome c reductase cytochrome c1 subunit
MRDRVKLGAAAILFSLAVAGGAAGAWAAGEGHIDIPRQKWSFGGFLGHFDDAQLQRGFKVYVDSCARCHGVKRLAFRNLAEAGGPGFPEAAIKSLAATYQVDDVPNEEGKVKKRPAIPSDYMPPPFKNEQEARYSNNGALPPDLSLMARARAPEADTPFYRVPDRMIADIVTGYQEGGADYIYAYLTGFTNPPASVKMADLMNYNKAFPGHQTAMPNPFIAGDGVLKYDDDTPPTVDNYARDVTAFLAWAADPKLEERKRLGWMVMLYLVITAVLLGLAKRRIWREVH